MVFAKNDLKLQNEVITNFFDFFSNIWHIISLVGMQTSYHIKHFTLKKLKYFVFCSEFYRWGHTKSFIKTGTICFSQCCNIRKLEEYRTYKHGKRTQQRREFHNNRQNKSILRPLIIFNWLRFISYRCKCDIYLQFTLTNVIEPKDRK